MRMSSLLRDMSENANDAQVMPNFVIITCLFFLALNGALLSYNHSLSLTRVFISYRNPFVRNLPEEFAYHIYFFTMGRFGRVTDEWRSWPHLEVIRPIYESMVGISNPVTSTYFLEHNIGNQLHPYLLQRPYVLSIRQKKLPIIK